MLVKMALRNLLRNRRRTLLTAIMMIGGFVVISASFSIIEGSYGNIIALFTSQHTGHVQIARQDYVENPGLQKTVFEYDSLLKKLQNDPDIRAVTARIYGEALVYLKNKALGAQIVGFDPNMESSATHYENRILLGEAFDNSLAYEALVGKKVAKILEVQIGDEIALISQGADGSVANDLFRVRGIIGTDQEGKDDYRIYLKINAAKEFFALYNQVHEISIHLKDFTQASRIANRLKLADKKLVARPWQKVEADFYKTMQADKQGSNVSIFILMLVVGVGILNTILMSTLERTREFGVIKALGTLPRQLFFLITLEGFFLSIISLLAGILLALGANYYLSHVGISFKEPISFAGMVISELKGTTSAKAFIYPALILSVTAVLASLYPGFKASRITVVQALREF